MVDPTRAVGQVQSLLSGNKTQETTQRRDQQQTQSSSAPVDEVSISEEALGIQEVERILSEVREQVAESEVSLGLDQDFLTRETEDA